MDLTCNRTWPKQYPLLLLQTIWALLSSRLRHEYFLSCWVTVTLQKVRPGQSLNEFSISVNACTVCDNPTADGRLAGWKLAMDRNIVSWEAVGIYPHIVHAEEECPAHAYTFYKDDVKKCHPWMVWGPISATYLYRSQHNETTDEHTWPKKNDLSSHEMYIRPKTISICRHLDS